jgi:hypothetical protein
MRKVVLAGLIAVAGCGSGKNDGSTMIDPAAQGACLDWANGVCRLAYLCVDEASRDAAFQARFGTDSEACWMGLLNRCQSNQAGATAFGPSCGPGKTVNQAAAATCRTDLETLACTDWLVTPAGNCGGICTMTTGTPDGGGGTVTTAIEYCQQSTALLCDRVGECDPTSLDPLGGVAGCKAFFLVLCDDPGLCPGGFNAGPVPACLNEIRAATCTVINDPAATFPSCELACLDTPVAN